MLALKTVHLQLAFFYCPFFFFLEFLQFQQCQYFVIQSSRQRAQRHEYKFGMSKSPGIVNCMSDEFICMKQKETQPAKQFLCRVVWKFSHTLVSLVNFSSFKNFMRLLQEFQMSCVSKCAPAICNLCCVYEIYLSVHFTSFTIWF